jgi:hypothetical protein
VCGTIVRRLCLRTTPCRPMVRISPEFSYHNWCQKPQLVVERIACEAPVQAVAPDARWRQRFNCGACLARPILAGAVQTDRTEVAPTTQSTRSNSRWMRCRGMVLIGSGLGALGTALPWAVAVYWGQPYEWTGWDLTYAHEPHFTVGLPPLLLALAGGAAAVASLRRPSLVRLSLGPGMLLVGYLGFFYTTYAAGPFRTSIQQHSGYSSSHLGPGFWLMSAGALLMVGGALAADSASSDVILGRVATWFVVAMLEYALLYMRGVLFEPPVLLLVIVAAGWGGIRSVRRWRQDASIDGIGDSNAVDSRPRGR